MIRLYDEMSFPRPKNGTIWNTNRCHRCRRWFIFIFVTELTVVTVRVHVGWFDLRTSQLRTIPCFERLAQFIFVEWFIWKFKGDIISRFFPMSLRWTYVVPTDASSSFRVKQDHILLVYYIFVGSSGILGAGPPPSYFTFCASSPLMYKPVFLQQLTNSQTTRIIHSTLPKPLFTSLGGLAIKEKFVLEHMRITFFYILLKPSTLSNTDLD